MPDRTKPTRLVSRSQEQAFLECHSDGRQWRHAGIVGAPEWMPPHGMHGAIARRSVCTSCGTERARWYTRSGEVENRYRHPEGYLHKRSAPDDYAPSRQDYRKRLVADLFAEVEQAERGA
jgi:hypothetical protein